MEPSVLVLVRTILACTATPMASPAISRSLLFGKGLSILLV